MDDDKENTTLNPNTSTTRMFEVKEDNMKKYSTLAKMLVSQFKCTRFEKVNRRNNQKAY